MLAAPPAMVQESLPAPAASTSVPASSKPNLSVQVSQTPGDSSFDGNTSINATPSEVGGATIKGLGSWQQPYSELSRFPSASYRNSKGNDWKPDGTRFMTPLPSPLDSRRRTFSDAASDTSSVEGESISSQHTWSNNHSTSRYRRSDAPSTSRIEGDRPVPSRTKTSSFFETMDSAFSPPPPPRMRSPERGSVEPLSFNSQPSNLLSPTLITPQSEAPGGWKRSSLSASMPPSTSSPSSTPTPALQPLSNLPSAFRSAAESSRTSSQTSIHDAGSSSMNLPKRSSPVLDSPLHSPTDSQSSKWARNPPERLPTLLPESLALDTFAASTSISEPAITPRPPTLKTSPLQQDTSASVAASPTSIATPSIRTPASECECGAILNDTWTVVRDLGIGAFSRVVLAKRIPRSTVAKPTTSAIGHKRSESGSYPSHLGKGHARSRSLGTASTSKLNQSMSWSDQQSSDTTETKTQEPDDLVAIKLINRNQIAKNDRMRISIVREVEVLKHIRHPSLVHLTSAFDTSFHTCLVLEYSPGGELFDFLANYHDQTSEALARRIFGELADALGWMHSIGLVHRDIKLENILLTSRPFSALAAKPTSFPDPSFLPTVPSPVVKLTDFGLSRFVDLSSPYLETRCGSEEYAAPELIMGKRYDGRQTDAWALGVVLYAIITGSLPFVEELSASQGPNVSPPRNGISPSAKGSAKSRRSYLLKIAKAEYTWPLEKEDAEGRSIATDTTRLASESVKTLVADLLKRDSKKRLMVADIWEHQWMQGPGAPEKRSMKGDLDGVSVAKFERDDEEVVRAEVPDL